MFPIVIEHPAANAMKYTFADYLPEMQLVLGMFWTNDSDSSLLCDVREIRFNHVHNCCSNWVIDMSVSDPRCRQGRNEGLIFLGPLIAAMLHPLSVGFAVDRWFNCTPPIWSWMCVVDGAQRSSRDPRMLTIPALARERFAQTSSLSVCLLSQRGTLASRPTALGTALSAQCRVALCIMESAGEAFNLNCIPTADSILVSAVVCCWLRPHWQSWCKKLLSEPFFNQKCALLSRMIHIYCF